MSAMRPVTPSPKTAYDTDRRISQINSAGLRTYSYDDASRVTGFTDTTAGAANWTFGYDELDRVTSAAGGSTTRGWTYDETGNRLSDTGSSPSTYNIDGASNRVTSTSGALTRTYTHDAAGHVLTYSNVTLTYNNRGRVANDLVWSGQMEKFIEEAKNKCGCK
jgi:YD repeat-containing protein